VVSKAIGGTRPSLYCQWMFGFLETLLSEITLKKFKELDEAYPHTHLVFGRLLGQKSLKGFNL